MKQESTQMQRAAEVFREEKLRERRIAGAQMLTMAQIEARKARAEQKRARRAKTPARQRLMSSTSAPATATRR